MTTVLNIARSFSRSPAGRYVTDGPFSGEAFRDIHLAPALASGQRVQVELDGVLGLGSSFLEEAFGGLVREHGYAPSALHDLLIVKSPLRTYEQRIWKYVDEARSRVGA